MMMAKLAATRSTCLAFPVGAVIVKDKQVLATGYNGPPSGSVHCNEQGFCYSELEVCGAGSPNPSRAVHAEANAIAQAAKHGIATDGASIYVTLEPCLHCLKLVISAGIRKVYYESPYESESIAVRNQFVWEGLLTLHRVWLRQESTEHAINSLRGL